MEYLAIVGVFGFIIAVVVWAIKFTKRMNERKQNLFKDFADRKGLSHSSEKRFLHTLNTIDGTLNNCHFQITEKIIGSGKNQQVMADVKFYNSPINFDFRISKEHLLTKVGKKFGLQDIEIGNDEFDNLFLLKSESENQMRDLINYDIQIELRNIVKEMSGSLIQKDEVFSYSVPGGLINEKAFKATERIIDVMIKMMNVRRR